ncbi:hypothetical protein SEEA9517_00200 [Salmonella enterica subsp. enterica serovar Agona str. 400095 17]|nr:hypothetical protein F515_19803 [Salmonella enterica subsp. enterica serovar Agona str. SH10GFN094]ELP13406.1 hypothetical protein F434_17611 [Salmonella enterica subsp. enterica serovar Agona str. SH11G1113]ELP15989.1 hypothetical protein F514_11259 [Salmonella enterica subsp. enterica serovar Agona str. SH08SF124]ESB04828.1 hypothetical protein SEEA3871_18899 [Salmonella enterica subsp. enterica serovar Agona str. 311387-1]ESB06879.1 hypothetical protein SEEA9787_17911 [Salmonella enterica
MFCTFLSLFYVHGEAICFIVPLAIHGIVPGVIKGDRQYLLVVCIQDTEVAFPVAAGVNAFLVSGIHEHPELFKSADHILPRRSDRRVANRPDTFLRFSLVR